MRAHPSEGQDFLERGFSLAHFIFPQRTTAVQILTGALNKLKAKTHQERKRAFWRDKFLKRGITRISRGDEDALQWLIYLESDSHEKVHEGLGQPRDEDMVVRYIKTLIRLSTGMSSFYVNIAIHRLLHGYTTSEAQQIYEFVTDQYREMDEYRRAKRLLMSRVESRFAGSIHNIKADHGENRYEAAENQEACRELVMTSLQMFTPWSTQEKCPFKHHPEAFSNRLHECLRANCEESSNQDKIEINRCHAFIDPACSSCIVLELGLASHSLRLEVPRFYMSVDENLRPPPRFPDSPLTPQERQAVASELSTEETRRKNVIPRELRFVVDGIELASLNLEESRELSFHTPPASQLLEIWTRDDRGALLLATHVMASDTAPLETTFALLLKSGGSVSVVLREVAHEANPWKVSVLVGERPRMPIVSNIRRWFIHALAFPAYAPTVVLLVTVLLLSVGLWRELDKGRTQETNLEAQLARYRGVLNSLRKPGIETVPTYVLTPDDLITRGNSKLQEHAVAVPSVPTVIDLVLPVTMPHGLYRVLLTKLDGGETILVEEGLFATARGTEPTITFSVPSNLLTSSKYYQLRLQDPTYHYVRTFTFYTSPTQ